MLSDSEREVVSKFLTDVVASSSSTPSNVNYIASHIVSVLVHAKDGALMDMIVRRPEALPIWRRLAQHVPAESTMLYMIDAAASADPPVDDVFTELARNRYITPGIAVTLIEKAPPGAKRAVLIRLVDNLDLPTSFVEEIVSAWPNWPEICAYSLIQRDDISPIMLHIAAEYLMKYSTFTSAYIRLAEHPRTPPSILEQLGERFDSIQFRKILAANPCTPARFLERYASDDHDAVRLAALANPSTPPEALVRAYRAIQRMKNAYRVSKFLEAIAQNPACPDDLLLALVLHYDGAVAAAARQNLKERGQAA